jgi:O-antigen/teichoic acid export membrane protein
VLPSLIQGAAAAVRAAPLCFRLAPHFSRPDLGGLRTIFVDGFGTWLSGWGWKLIYSTNATILAATGRADLAPVFACSTKVGMALMQLSWVPGDSGLVGLAQLKEEAAPDRVRRTTAAMLRLYLFGAGACAVFVLAVNPGLVTLWVGGPMFAGSSFNALLAASILLLSAAHAAGCIASIMGERLPVGLLTLAGGAVHAGLAYLLAGRYGLEGILYASIASHLTVLVPGALYLARKRGALGMAQIRSLATVGSAAALAGFAAASFYAGRALSDPPPWGLAAAALAAAIGYLWIARDLYAPLLETGSVAHAVSRVRALAGGWLRASEPAGGD